MAPSNIRTKEMPLGWLAPDGSFFECKYYEHVSKAEEIIELLGIDECSIYVPVDDFLFKLGYTKICQSSLGDKQYIVYWDKRLTPYQRYYLEDYFDNEKELKFPMSSTSICRWRYEDDIIKE